MHSQKDSGERVCSGLQKGCWCSVTREDCSAYLQDGAFLSAEGGMDKKDKLSEEAMCVSSKAGGIRNFTNPYLSLRLRASLFVSALFWPGA